MVPQMAIFGDFLRPVFSASRVQHVSDLHLKFALRPATPCVEVWQTSDLRSLRLGEEKKKKMERWKKEGKKLQGKNIMAPYYIGRP